MKVPSGAVPQALKNANALDKVKVGAIDATTDAINAVAAGDLITSVGGGYACGAFALVELFDHLNGHEPKSRSVNIPLLGVTADNVEKYRSGAQRDGDVRFQGCLADIHSDRVHRRLRGHAQVTPP